MRPRIVRIERIERTCTACPAQWDAWDADGQQYYIRYRSGWLSIDAVSGPNWVHDHSKPVRVVGLEHGDSHCGWMDEAKLFDLTAGDFWWDVTVEGRAS